MIIEDIVDELLGLELSFIKRDDPETVYGKDWVESIYEFIESLCHDDVIEKYYVTSGVWLTGEPGYNYERTGVVYIVTSYWLTIVTIAPQPLFATKCPLDEINNFSTLRELHGDGRKSFQYYFQMGSETVNFRHEQAVDKLVDFFTYLGAKIKKVKHND